MDAFAHSIKRSSPPCVRLLLLLLIAIEALIFSQCLRTSLGWINEPFPGFLVLKNRVVAAAGCPFWKELRREEIFHAQVQEINGEQVRDARDVHAFFRSEKEVAGAPIWYRVETILGGGELFRAGLHRFRVLDYLCLFGVYMLNGLLYLSLGIICVLRWPRWVSSPGFLAVGVATSLWTFTACDLYGPYRFFHLHILAEALLPAAILHLAGVFPGPPGNRNPGLKRLLPLYTAFFLFGLFYESSAMDQAAYSLCNRVATAALGLALFTLLARCMHAFFRGSVIFPRTALRSLILFASAALVPSICIALSMALRGHPPVNYLGYTSFLLPIGFGVALFQWKKEEKSGADIKELDVQEAPV